MGPLARQARSQVFELSQFDLQLAGQAAGALGKDVENQLAAVDDLEIQGFFQVTLLGGGQVVVKDDRAGAGFHRQLLHLSDLAGTDESGRVDALAQGLNDPTCDFEAGGLA